MSEAPSLILQPSAINGVGVFAARNIHAGDRPPLFDPDDWRIIRDLSVVGVGAKYATPGDDDGPWYVPTDFHRMSIGWYLNNSDAPNIDAKTFAALREILIGEELTIDYSQLAEVVLQLETS